MRGTRRRGGSSTVASHGRRGWKGVFLIDSLAQKAILARSSMVNMHVPVACTAGLQSGVVVDVIDQA